MRAKNLYGGEMGSRDQDEDEVQPYCLAPCPDMLVIGQGVGVDPAGVYPMLGLGVLE